MKKLFRKFNRREYTFEDFVRICRRQRINVESYAMNPKVRGYYTTELRKVYRKKWIAFNDDLYGLEKLYIAFHELAHHFLHVTFTNKQTFYCRATRMHDSKNDIEADAIALIMMIPLPKLLEMQEVPFENLSPIHQRFLIRRQYVYDEYGL